MLRTMCKSKIHGAIVTGANLNYTGSITIDAELMKEADILPYEKVQVVNNHNGSRFETYVIEGSPHGGEICLNGAAARLVQPGDKILIISYAVFDSAELARYQPRVVFVDKKNRITAIKTEDAFFNGSSAG